VTLWGDAFLKTVFLSAYASALGEVLRCSFPRHRFIVSLAFLYLSNVLFLFIFSSQRRLNRGSVCLFFLSVLFSDLVLLFGSGYCGSLLVDPPFFSCFFYFPLCIVAGFSHDYWVFVVCHFKKEFVSSILSDHVELSFNSFIPVPFILSTSIGLRELFVQRHTNLRT